MITKRKRGVKNKNILIVDFNFLIPNQAGSYRWLCFAKYFAKEKYKVHIITVDWNMKSYQSWKKDLKNKNITIHKISSLYIHNFKYKKFPDTLLGLLLKGFRNQLLKLLSFFRFVDEAQYWGYSLISYCNKLIEKEKIKCVIATGAPFMTNYWAARLKEKLPGIKLIQDLRDEWNEFRKFSFSFHKKRSEEYELFSLNNCDAIVTTSQGLLELFNKKITNDKVKKNIIYNGYDRINFSTDKEIERDFSFIYAGSLSNDRDKVLFTFLDIVKENITDLKEIKIYIYSEDYNKITKRYKDLINNGNLYLEGLIPQKELFKKIFNSFVALHFMPITQKYIISIKLFEYGFLGRPVLSLNCGGDTDLIVRNHNLGISVNYIDGIKEIKKILLEIHAIWKKNPKSSINPVGLRRYSYENLSKEYLKIIQEL